MGIVLFIVIILIATFVLLLFTAPVRISFLLDSDTMIMQAFISWISVLRIKAEVVNLKVRISVTLFNKKIISKPLKRRRNAGNISYSTIRNALDLQHTKIRIFYGLSKPHLTGLFCGAVNFISALIKSETIEQYPDFIPSEEFLRIEASTTLNAGKTLSNLIKLRLNEKKRSRYHGPVKLN
jgi:hypothetical protein